MTDYPELDPCVTNAHSWGAHHGRDAETAVLETTGSAVIATDDPDVIRRTRPERERLGPVWVFDPTGAFGEGETQVWWDPLTGITALDGARRIAGLLSDHGDTSCDGFFAGGARELLALYLLGAVCTGSDVGDVLRWLRLGTPPLTDALARSGHRHAAEALRRLTWLDSAARDRLAVTARHLVLGLADHRVLSRLTRPELGADTRSVTSVLASLTDRPGTLYTLYRPRSRILYRAGQSHISERLCTAAVEALGPSLLTPAGPDQGQNNGSSMLEIVQFRAE